MNTLLGTIGGIEYYNDLIKHGDKLNASDMSTLISSHIILSSYKSLFEHINWSDELFMTWVREETGTKIDRPIVIVDPVDPVDEESKELSDLTVEEIEALKSSLNKFEDLQDKLDRNQTLADNETAEMTGLRLILDVFKTILDKEQDSDKEFIAWVREELSHERPVKQRDIPEIKELSADETNALLSTIGGI